MGLPEICDGLATRFATISGLRAHAEPPPVVNPPAIIIGDPMSGSYDMALGNGGVAHRMSAILLVTQAGGKVRALEAVKGYIAATGAQSIRAALQADVTLGGAADSSRVVGYHDIGVIEYAGTPFMGVILDIEAWES